MFRPLLWLAALSVAASITGCGPDNRRRCTGPHPDFVVVLELSDRPLPPDTVVRVTYGGSGIEEYSLAHPKDPEVVFCDPANLDGGVLPDAGADGGGPDLSQGVSALRCELWTAGYAKLEVRSSQNPTVTFNLAPREQLCTVEETFVLDKPDAG